MQPIEKRDPVFKLLLVGDAGVGKSCLVKRYTVDKFEQGNSSTIGEMSDWIGRVTEELSEISRGGFHD